MNRPFAVLEELVRSGRMKFANGTVDGEQRDFAIPKLPRGMADDELFGHAMKDVRALGWSAVPLHHRPPLEIQPQDGEAEALRVLEEFLRNGNVEVEQTPRYFMTPSWPGPARGLRRLPTSRAPPCGQEGGHRAVEEAKATGEFSRLLITADMSPLGAGACIAKLRQTASPWPLCPPLPPFLFPLSSESSF